MERCRPYFICLLGDRFGWSQTEKKKDKLLDKSYEFAIDNFKQFKWLQEYRFDTSVTKVSEFAFHNFKQFKWLQDKPWNNGRNGANLRS